MREHNVQRINEILRGAGVVCAGRVHWFARVDSTNSWLLRQGEVHGRVCITEAQSAGRGSRGRIWRAWRGAVLVSIGWRLEGEGGVAVPASGLSLVSGLAVVEAVRKTGGGGGAEGGTEGFGVGLKWPNDLLAQNCGEGLRGKKVGGILVELKEGNAVIGVGLNVCPPMDAEAGIAEEAGAWADLQSLGYGGGDGYRDALVANLLIAHCDYLQRFCATGFGQFVGEWNALNVQQGMAVSVTLGDEVMRGVVEGVDAEGALLLRQNRARRRIISSQARFDDETTDGCRQ